MANIFFDLKKLAKYSESQNLFIASKEIQGIRLFDNEKDFTSIQLNYLSLLSHYNFLNREVDMDEVSELVLKDDIYGESYAYWKKKKGMEYQKKQVKAKNTGKEKPDGKHLKILFK